jgi:hypothetical protein
MVQLYESRIPSRQDLSYQINHSSAIYTIVGTTKVIVFSQKRRLIFEKMFIITRNLTLDKNLNFRIFAKRFFFPIQKIRKLNTTYVHIYFFILHISLRHKIFYHHVLYLSTHIWAPVSETVHRRYPKIRSLNLKVILAIGSMARGSETVHRRFLIYNWAKGQLPL